MARVRWSAQALQRGSPSPSSCPGRSRPERRTREKFGALAGKRVVFSRSRCMVLHPPPHLLLPTPSFAFQPSRPSLRVIAGPTPQALGVRVSTSCRLDPKALLNLVSAGGDAHTIRAWVQTKHSPTWADHDVSPSCRARALDAWLDVSASLQLHQCTWTLRHWSQRHLASRWKMRLVGILTSDRALLVAPERWQRNQGNRL